MKLLYVANTLEPLAKEEGEGENMVVQPECKYAESLAFWGRCPTHFHRLGNFFKVFQPCFLPRIQAFCQALAKHWQLFVLF